MKTLILLLVLTTLVGCNSSNGLSLVGETANSEGKKILIYQDGKDYCWAYEKAPNFSCNDASVYKPDVLLLRDSQGSWKKFTWMKY